MKSLSYNLIFSLIATTFIFAACQKENELLLGPDLQELESELAFQEQDHLVKGCMEIIPEGENQKDEREKAAAHRASLWNVGQTIRVRLLGGSPLVQSKVQEYAREWELYANIHFEFVGEGEAEIRVAFDRGGSWSYIGKDALWIPQTKPTMNFGWFSDRTSEREFSRTTIHEFGHALGLKHEHQHPRHHIQWDTAAVYAYYTGAPNNWTRAQVDRNIFARYNETRTQFCAYDPLSIMHYSISNAHTLNDFAVNWNTELSEEDKHFIGLVYPFSGSRQNIDCGEAGAGSYVLSQKPYDFKVVDINGDGKSDIVNLFETKDDQAGLWLHLSAGKNFQLQSEHLQTLADYGERQSWLRGDFNGDGKGDLVNVYPGKDGKMQAQLHLSDGNKPASGSNVQTLTNIVNDQQWLAGDFNGDGRDDLIHIYGDPNQITQTYLYLSNGRGFNARSNSQRLANFSNQQTWIAADFNGDGRDDLVNLYEGANQKTRVWLHLSTGAGFENFSNLQMFGGFSGPQKWLAGDFNGDGRDDLVNIYGNSSLKTQAYLHLSNGGSFQYRSNLQTLAGFSQSQQWRVGDFNDDGRDDLLNVYAENDQLMGWTHLAQGNGFAYQSNNQQLAEIRD